MAFDPPQPTMGAHGGLARVERLTGSRNGTAALAHPTNEEPARRQFLHMLFRGRWHVWTKA